MFKCSRVVVTVVSSCHTKSMLASLHRFLIWWLLFVYFCFSFSNPCVCVCVCSFVIPCFKLKTFHVVTRNMFSNFHQVYHQHSLCVWRSCCVCFMYWNIISIRWLYFFFCKRRNITRKCYLFWDMLSSLKLLLHTVSFCALCSLRFFCMFIIILGWTQLSFAIVCVCR